MKTKPHGYAHRILLGLFTNPQVGSPGILEIYCAKGDGIAVTEPVCLVSPATCDRVREFIEEVRDVASNLFNNPLHDKADELLKLLPEVGE